MKNDAELIINKKKYHYVYFYEKIKKLLRVETAICPVF